MRDIWNGLTPETRRTIIRAAAVLAVVVVVSAAATGQFGELLRVVME